MPAPARHSRARTAVPLLCSLRYWYNRRTGETYWEPPLPEPTVEHEEADEEEVDLLMLGEKDPDDPTAALWETSSQYSFDEYERDDEGNLVNAWRIEAIKKVRLGPGSICRPCAGNTIVACGKGVGRRGLQPHLWRCLHVTRL